MEITFSRSLQMEVSISLIEFPIGFMNVVLFESYFVYDKNMSIILTFRVLLHKKL